MKMDIKILIIEEDKEAIIEMMRMMKTMMVTITVKELAAKLNDDYYLSKLSDSDEA